MIQEERQSNMIVASTRCFLVSEDRFASTVNLIGFTSDDPSLASVKIEQVKGWFSIMLVVYIRAIGVSKKYATDLPILIYFNFTRPW